LLLIACLLTSLSLQIRAMKTVYEQATLNASKLEIALLKKNIQPHFLMNTLTSVIECLEFAPDQAIKFIMALAEEFELICQVSDKQLIAITDEIRLCQYHLDIMGLQKQISYSLELVNIDHTEQVPPGLFHTLVENGITHNVYRRPHVSFRLAMESTETGRRYTLLTPKADRVSNKKPGTGLGNKYIQMRLDESYPGCWRLEQTDSPHGWLTTIDIAFSPSDSP
jgi:LytS/YehU family sensor histidine kinase